MQRPTCKTCPYWDAQIDGETDEPNGFGECHRSFPRLPVTSTQEKQAGEKSSGDEYYRVATGLFPITEFFDWCGEHPSFPAYAAEFARQLPAEV